MDWLIKAAYAAGEGMTEAGLRAIDWFTWLWVVGMSLLGGFVSFYQKLKAGKARPFNIAEFIGELGISGLVGIVTFLLCKEWDVSEYLSAALVGITAHMGSRAIMMFEQYVERFFSKKSAP